jgi:Mlc titration factor MtfA (ptsG expression regulator)
MWGWWQRRRRQRWLRQPLPPAWRQIVDRNVGMFRLLPANAAERLLSLTHVIAQERHFAGQRGLEITDEVRVTIAAQAACLVLGTPDYFFERVPTIYVSPRRPRIKAVHPIDTLALVEEGVVVDGQVLEQGEVFLAWREVLRGCRNPSDGHNVVLHEFAHHLDWLDGAIDGVPPLPAAAQRHFRNVIVEEGHRLRDALEAGEPTLLHEEAADGPAELFAYATELFYERPHQLAAAHPELFACLEAFYHVDPRAWHDQAAGWPA